MVTFPMVSSLSLLVERPSAATGQSVYKVATSRHSNGTSYPLSFQYGCQPLFPSWLNGKPSIPFPFIPLRTFSVATGGYTPLPHQFRSPLRQTRPVPPFPRPCILTTLLPGF